MGALPGRGQGFSGKALDEKHQGSALDPVFLALALPRLFFFRSVLLPFSSCLTGAVSNAFTVGVFRLGLFGVVPVIPETIRFYLTNCTTPQNPNLKSPKKNRCRRRQSRPTRS